VFLVIESSNFSSERERGKKERKMRILCCLAILTFEYLHAGSFGAGSRALVGRGVRGLPAVLRGGGGGGGCSGSAAGLACKSASSTASGSEHDHGGENLRVMLLSGNARLPCKFCFEPVLPRILCPSSHIHRVRGSSSSTPINARVQAKGERG
jgi:hypothetical protein